MDSKNELVRTCSAYEAKEQRGFLRNRRGRNLYYALHMPISPAPVENAWIFCNPLFEEKVFSHGIYVQFARYLAANGYTVLRFDYEGDGDSEGEFDGIDLTMWRDDIVDMAAHLRRLHPQVITNLFGLRFGAYMAALSASHTASKSMLFWEPVHDGEAYMRDYQKINLASHLFTSKKEIKDRESLIRNLNAKWTINIAGYDISEKLFEQIKHSKLTIIVSPLRSMVRIAAVAINRPGTKAARLEVAELASSPDLFVMINSHPFWFGPRIINMQPEVLFGNSLELIQSMGIPIPPTVDVESSASPS